MYDFDAFKLHIMYGQAYDGLFGLRDRNDGEIADGLFNPLRAARYVKEADPLAKGYRLQAWMVGLTVPVGENGNILFSYQGNVQKNHRAEANLNPDHPAKAYGHIASLAYTQDVTKRSSFYALVSHGCSTEKQHDGWSTRYKTKQTLFAIGFAHKF